MKCDWCQISTVDPIKLDNQNLCKECAARNGIMSIIGFIVVLFVLGVIFTALNILYIWST